MRRHLSPPSVVKPVKNLISNSSPLTIEETKKLVLHFRYKKFISTLSPNMIVEKANTLLGDLASLNGKNGAQINKFCDACYGKSQKIQYDAASLYTRAEM